MARRKSMDRGPEATEPTQTMPTVRGRCRRRRRRRGRFRNDGWTRGSLEDQNDSRMRPSMQNSTLYAES